MPAVFKAEAIQQVDGTAATLANLCHAKPDFPPAAIIATATNSADDHVWHRLIEIAGNVPELRESMTQQGVAPPAAHFRTTRGRKPRSSARPSTPRST